MKEQARTVFTRLLPPLGQTLSRRLNRPIPVPMKPMTTPINRRGLPATVPTQPTAAVKTSVMVDRTAPIVRAAAVVASILVLLLQ